MICKLIQVVMIKHQGQWKTMEKRVFVHAIYVYIWDWNHDWKFKNRTPVYSNEWFLIIEHKSTWSFQRLEISGSFGVCLVLDPNARKSGNSEKRPQKPSKRPQKHARHRKKNKTPKTLKKPKRPIFFGSWKLQVSSNFDATLIIPCTINPQRPVHLCQIILIDVITT